MEHLRSPLLLFVLVAILINNQISVVANSVRDLNRIARVAVTGSNRGIGFAVVQGLCQQFDGFDYLTARTETQDLAAVQELNKIGFHPRFHQLDITDDSSIEALINFINATAGGLDILVNNAGISFQV